MTEEEKVLAVSVLWAGGSEEWVLDVDEVERGERGEGKVPEAGETRPASPRSWGSYLTAEGKGDAAELQEVWSLHKGREGAVI